MYPPLFFFRKCVVFWEVPWRRLRTGLTSVKLPSSFMEVREKSFLIVKAEGLTSSFGVYVNTVRPVLSDTCVIRSTLLSYTLSVPTSNASPSRRITGFFNLFVKCQAQH